MCLFINMFFVILALNWSNISYFSFPITFFPRQLLSYISLHRQFPLARGNHSDNEFTRSRRFMRFFGNKNRIRQMNGIAQEFASWSVENQCCNRAISRAFTRSGGRPDYVTKTSPRKPHAVLSVLFRKESACPAVHRTLL